MDLFNFMYDGYKVFVFKDDKTSKVYYRINKGNSTSTGMNYDDDSGLYEYYGKYLKEVVATDVVKKLLRG